MAVPWWALSPSPMTLAFYSVLAFYGAYKLGSRTKWEWVTNFAESAFLIGVVILPFDSCWQLFQWFKFGYLYPEEVVMVGNVLIRNVSVLSLCLLSSWKLSDRTLLIDLKKGVFVLLPIVFLLLNFLFLSDPGWTDWTYGMRFASSASWVLSYLSSLPIRFMLGFVFVALWKDNFIVGRKGG